MQTTHTSSPATGLGNKKKLVLHPLLAAWAAETEEGKRTVQAMEKILHSLPPKAVLELTPQGLRVGFFVEAKDASEADQKLKERLKDTPFGSDESGPWKWEQMPILPGCKPI